MTEVEFAKGLEGVLAAKSVLSFIDGKVGILKYYGMKIEEIAKYATFEEICYLMWNRELPKKDQLDSMRAEMNANRDIPDVVLDTVKKFPKDSHPMDALRTGVSILGLFDPEAQDDSLEAKKRVSLRITAKMPTIAAAFARTREGKDFVPPKKDIDTAANFLYMLKGEEPQEHHVRILDVALVLHVDHGMNASTFANMVTASTLSDIYSAVVTGIGTLKGPLHGGANERVLKMLQEIGGVGKAENWVLDSIKQKRKIMGFGHRVYKSYDPRAAILKEYARQLCEEKGDMTLYEMGDIIEKVMIRELGEAKGIYPNVDFYSGIVYHHLGIPTDIFTPIFAIARVGGWTGHALEYLEDNRIFRPRQVYVGPETKEYIPIEKR